MQKPVDTAILAQEKFGAGSPQRSALKAGEEMGEVIGAVVRFTEGRGEGTEVMKETGDLLFCLNQLAYFHAFTLEEALDYATRKNQAKPDHKP